MKTIGLSKKLFLFLVLSFAGIQGFLFPAIAQSTFDPPPEGLRVKNRPYKIGEYWGTDTERSDDPIQPLEDFLFWKFAGEDIENPVLRELIEARQFQSRSLGSMRRALESKTSAEKAEIEKALGKPEDVIKEAEAAFYQQLSLEELVAEAVEEGRLSEDLARDIESQIETLRMKSKRIAREVWELREKGVQEGKRREGDLERDDFETALNKNEIFHEGGGGLAELNWVDGIKFIRVLHPELDESIAFLKIGKHHPRSFHALKYVAAQHVSSGVSRTDGQVGRDHIQMWVSDTDGVEKVDHIRYYPRFKRVPFNPGNWRDNFLYLDADNNNIEKCIKGAVNGLGFGFLQGTLTFLMDQSQVWLGIKDAHIRWDIIFFSAAFSTFWGYFQPNLKKFTNNPVLTNTERTLRRMVTTSLTFNSIAYMMTYNTSVFDLTTVVGAMFVAKLLFNIWLSNAIKTDLEKPIKTDQRQRLNTDEVILRIPRTSLSVLRAPVDLLIRIAPTKGVQKMLLRLRLPGRIGSGNKKSDYQMRFVSLFTFGIRMLDISNFKVPIPGTGIEISIGKVVLVGMWPVAKLRAVRHAEKRGSDLAPKERADWERFKSRMMAPVRPFTWAYSKLFGGKSQLADQPLRVEYIEAPGNPDAIEATPDGDKCKISLREIGPHSI